MAFKRRRRKARPLWFPPLGTAFAISEDTTVFGPNTFQLDVLASGAITFSEIPLTFDFGQEAALADEQANPGTVKLANLMSSAWRLRRIVGNLYATFSVNLSNANDPNQDSPPAAWFAAGFMVRNVDEFGVPVGINVDLLNQDDYTDPWIWRRVWLLGQGATDTRYRDSGNIARFNNLPATDQANANPASAAANYPFTHFPNNNIAYGTAVGGPYIDSHTNRVIGPEQRLFLHLATKAIPIQPQPYAFSNRISGSWDLRYLGNLQRATNRRNAAR